MNKVRLESLQKEALRPYEIVGSVVRLFINNHWYLARLKSTLEHDENVFRVWLCPRIRYRCSAHLGPEDPGTELVSRNHGTVIESYQDDGQPFILRNPRQLRIEEEQRILVIQAADKDWTAVISSREVDLKTFEYFLKLTAQNQGIS